MTSKELSIPKVYDPAKTEDHWYSYWEKQGYFKSKPDDREPYTVVIPPPNVTGVLHMGHMLNNTIQDVLVRRARMLGKNACWVPGTDHASIATEAKVVGKLRKKGILKRDLSRDEFMEHAWEWTREHGGIILQQLRKLGASCDWDRTRFTLEKDLHDAVIESFITLYERGYIYRGQRMVNWDPEARTALSDEEVIHKEVRSKFYYVKYPVQGSDEFLTIATTRPETILADTAVCVHPDDERFKHLIGKTVLVPIVNRPVKVIGDDYVDPEFGTGCLKITPAHDTNDYDLGQKHGLEIIDMLHDDGRLNEHGGKFEGMDRFEARKAVAKELEDQELLVKVEEMDNKVGFSERTDAVIEPRLSLQWFLKMDEISKPALENVMNDTIRFHPAKMKNSYRNWMENIHDWCISRQLWWGQRIPAWYYGNEPDQYVIAKTREEAIAEVKKRTGSEPEELRQDEDVLDTWFSSWLWPISVFDGFKDPDNEEVKYYYPTNDLVTAPEIMFFWVARMIIAGYEFKGEKPFSNVYFHGIVRDKKRRKMSKSLGNSPDPLELIKEFGADGTRVGMLFSSPAGNDLLFDEALCEQGRNFANKIWNAFRFLCMNMEEGKTYTPVYDENPESLTDRWILSRIHSTIQELEQSFEQFRLNEALQKIYSLVWDDFCDWYIELIKPGKPGQKIEHAQLCRALGYFENLMKLLHPFMPFITEEIWQRIQNRDEKTALTITALPELNSAAISSETEAQFTQIQQIISALRNIRAEKNLSPNAELDVYIKTTGNDAAQKLNEVSDLIKQLQQTGKLEISANVERPGMCATALVQGLEIMVPLADHVDPEQERARITKELNRLEGFMTSINKKLSNEKFVANAPDAVVEKERKKLSDAKLSIEKLQAQLNEL